MESTDHSRKMSIPFIAKTANAESDCDANGESYPCGPHGPETQNYLLANTNESLFPTLLDDE